MNTPAVNDLHPFWMPFSANRAFKADPRLFVSAKDMYYQTPDGREVLAPPLPRRSRNRPLSSTTPRPSNSAILWPMSWPAVWR
jgi:hypothetical protein